MRGSKSDIHIDNRGNIYQRLSSGIHVKLGTVPPPKKYVPPYVNVEGELIKGAIPLVIIFSYNRGEMLLKNLQQIYEGKKKYRVVVVDDGSKYDFTEHSKLCEYYRVEHHGKGGFWKIWNLVLQIARVHGSDFNLFAGDDFLNLNIHKMISDVKSFPDEYVCNVINDGRESNWGDKIWEPYGKKWIECNFTDCGFFCPYSVLQKLEFNVIPIPQKSEEVSSGVGRQITLRLRKLQIPMYVPVKSYAFHGDHQSVMHPKVRKNNPLISK